VGQISIEDDLPGPGRTFFGASKYEQKVTEAPSFLYFTLNNEKYRF